MLKFYNTKNPLIIFKINVINNIPVLIIENNGKKIEKKNIDNIFNPYFTTKFNKNGTGIGLYMAKTLMEESMGKNISFENTTNGVSFILKG